jgi:hypothetical protein
LADDKLKEFTREWSELEELLRPIFARCPRKQSDQLLHLICRGKKLFELGSATSHLPLLELIQKIEIQETLPKSLSKKVVSFGNRLFPSHEVKKMRFHSQIHALANISTHQPYELRPETIEVLRKKHRDLVESLSDMPDNQKNWHFRTPLVKYSKVLRRRGSVP